MGMKNSATAAEASSETTTARPEIAERLPGDSLDEDHREEDRDRGQRRGDHRAAHLEVPRTAAAATSSPSSRQRKIDSSTTIEESTSMPMPRASPPSDMMFSVTPSRCSGAKVISSEIGMLTAMIAGALEVAQEQVEDQDRQQAAA